MAGLFSKILCPIDFERDSMEALEFACRLAKQNSATVYLLTVVGVPVAATELPPVAIYPNPAVETVCRERLEAIAQEKLQKFRMRFLSQAETRRRRFSISPLNEASI